MYKEITKANMKLQLERINKQLWTNGDILAFAKLLNSYRFSSQERKKQIMDLWDKLETRAYTHSYSITKDQSEFGIEWLKKSALRRMDKTETQKWYKIFLETIMIL
jgi:hypothetical protein